MRENCTTQYKILKIYTFSPGGGNAILWTKRFYGHLGVSDSGRTDVSRIFSFEPRGSTGVQRYGCIPRSAANSLGEIPQKSGAPNPLFSSVLLCREHFGTRPCQSPSRFGIRLHFLRPHFPSPNSFEPPDFFADCVVGFFSSFSWGKSAQKNPPRKAPDKIRQILYYKKSLTMFCIGARPKIHPKRSTN